MLLKPFNSETGGTSQQFKDGSVNRDSGDANGRISGVRAALTEAGLLSAPESKDKDKLEKARAILDSNGASLENAASAVGHALFSEDQRLRAAELTFRLHGLMKEDTLSKVPTINIVFGSQHNQELTAFLTPRET